MDAATPLCRSLLLAGLIAVVSGCQSAPVTTARPQMPAEGPLAPVGGPPAVAGQPVTPAATAAPAADAGMGTPRIKIVAHVGNKNIVTDQEVWEATRQRMFDYCTPVEGAKGQMTVVRDPAKEKAVYAEELKRIVDRELVLDEMEARLKKNGKPGVLDDIKEFAGKAADRRLRDRKKAWKLPDDEAFKLVLASQGLTLPVIRRQLERQAMADEYVRNMLREKGKGVGLADVRAYYDRHPDDFRTADTVKWQHIFVSSGRFPNPQAAAAHAEAVRAQAAAGADFAALSKQHDHGLAGGQGGEGIGTKRGEVQPADVEPTVWALKAGEVGAVVETPAGYHIVKVAEREYAGVRPYDQKTQAEIRDKLTDAMIQREYKRLVEDLWRRGVVKVME